jgi:hypothetical protein
MFRHNCVIFGDPVVCILLTYISMSKQLLVIKFKISQIYFDEDDTIESKHLGAVFKERHNKNCHLIVHLWFQCTK